MNVIGPLPYSHSGLSVYGNVIKYKCLSAQVCLTLSCQESDSCYRSPQQNKPNALKMHLKYLKRLLEPYSYKILLSNQPIMDI